MTAEDDGIAQKVTRKRGIDNRIESVKLEPIVKLSPYRTFREIEQPEDRFLLRITAGEPGKLPTVALHEAGGSAWKITAINSIYEYLTDKLNPQHKVIR